MSLFRQSASAGAQTLLIEGASGIGKSALVHEAAARARQLGFRVLSGRADELDGRRSFGLLVDCLGGEWLRGVGDESRPAVLGHDALGALAESNRGAADVEFRVSEAAIEAVERHCAEDALVLILEDLHWADAASLYAIRRIVRHSVSLPLVLLGTLRPLPQSTELIGLLADVGDQHRLVLGPLDRADIGQLLRDELGATPGPHLCRQADMAGGNPLFVLELLDALRAEGALQPPLAPLSVEHVVEIARAVSPPSLRLTILHRLSFLSPDTLRMLGLAAVLGARFRPTHLARLANRSPADLLASLRDALAAGLLTDAGDDLSFRHDLVREALYADLPSAMRAGLHRDAARVLARSGASAGLVGEHLLRGAEPGDDEAITWLQQAGRTLAPTTPSVAVGLLECAMKLADPARPLALDIKGDLATALMWAGRPVEGEALCHEALSSIADAARRTALRQQLVESLLHRGQAASVIREVDVGLDECPLDARSRARLEVASALARLFVGDVDGARARARALECAGGTPADIGVSARAFVVQALAAEQSGEILEAADLAGRAVALADATDSRDAHETVPHLTQSMFLLDTDQFDAAVARLERGREAQESFGGRGSLPIHHFCFGFARFWSGAWDEAAAEIETGIALAEETQTGWRATPCGIRAVIALARGEERSIAEGWLRSGEAALAAGEAPYRVEWLEWARVLWGALNGDTLPAARAPVRPSIVLATTGPTIARLAIEHGHRDVARSIADALGRLATLNAGARGIAAAHTTVRGLLADDPRLLASAVEIYRAVGRPLEQAFAGEWAALSAARTGRRSDARAMLAAALDAYGRLGALAFAAGASRRLARVGIRVKRSGLAPRRPIDGWDSLTATEQRVLRLIAARRTNPEIARELGVSRRTVETHVSHILARVDLRSRVELAAGAARHFGWRLRLEDVAEDGEQP